MSFGLGHGKPLDPALGTVGVGPDELGPLPDDAVLHDRTLGLVDPRPWFADPDLPFEIEIGSGKGTFLLAQGCADPATNLLGIEWTREFYAYAADRVRRRREAGELHNVRLLNADATEYLRWRCPPRVARVIHLYFSDPWPKKRHHKKRVVQDGFMRDAWNALTPGGELRVVTDHDELWAWCEAHFTRWTAPGALDPDSRPGMPDPPFAREPFERPDSAGEGELVGTNFERKFRREGRGFHAGVLRKPGGDA